jgi:hypothetical protein
MTTMTMRGTANPLRKGHRYVHIVVFLFYSILIIITNYIRRLQRRRRPKLRQRMLARKCCRPLMMW